MFPEDLPAYFHASKIDVSCWIVFTTAHPTDTLSLSLHYKAHDILIYVICGKLTKSLCGSSKLKPYCEATG